MTRNQRLQYDRYVRVRNFGLAMRGVFPESSGVGRAFAVIAAAVSAIEDHMTRRAEARADARRVRTTTRQALSDAMRAIAATGRRVSASETGSRPFRMPRRQSVEVVLSTARQLLNEAQRREEGFVNLGMPPTFLADFRQRIDDLDRATNVQRDSRAHRRRADGGIATALAAAANALRDLDVAVPNAMRGDPVGLAQWSGARHLDGQASRPLATPLAPSPAQPEVTTPVAATSPPAGSGTEAAPADVLRIDRAS